MEQEYTDKEFLLSVAERIEDPEMDSFDSCDAATLREIANAELSVQLIMLQVNNAVFYVLDDSDNVEQFVAMSNSFFGDPKVSRLTRPITSQRIDLSDLDEIANCHVIEGVPLRETLPAGGEQLLPQELYHIMRIEGAHAYTFDNEILVYTDKDKADKYCARLNKNFYPHNYEVHSVLPTSSNHF